MAATNKAPVRALSGQRPRVSSRLIVAELMDQHSKSQALQKN